MTRGGDLCNPTVLTPRPADSPLRHLADPRWRVAAKQGGEIFVAEAAPGCERVVEMRLPIIWTFFAERRRYRHLRHDRRAAAADQALIGQQDMPGPGARRRDRRVHAGASGPDNQHIGGEIDHAEDLVPLARIATIGTAKPSPRR